jgi:hypothetical protein
MAACNQNTGSTLSGLFFGSRSNTKNPSSAQIISRKLSTVITMPENTYMPFLTMEMIEFNSITTAKISGNHLKEFLRKSEQYAATKRIKYTGA